MNPSSRILIVAAVLGVVVSGCCGVPCVPVCPESPPPSSGPILQAARSLPTAPSPATPRRSPESGITNVINGKRGVVILSGLWDDHDALTRAGALLRERGIFSFVSTGIGLELIVAADEAATVRSILKADPICGKLYIPNDPLD